MTDQLGRETQLDRAAVAQAGGDQHPLGQQPGSTIENGSCAAGTDIEPGRVDHQHRRPAAAQKPTPGQIDRFARTAALRETRLLHALQPLQRGQLPGLGETRQRASERGRRRLCTRQRSGVRVKPARQRLKPAHGDASSPPFGSATM